MARASAPGSSSDEARIEATGEADSTESSARTRAIDRAFVAALDKAVGDIVDRAARDAHDKEIREAILRRARRFVLSFKTLEESEKDGRLRVRVEARIDLGRLRDELQELGVTTGGTGTAPSGDDSDPVEPEAPDSGSRGPRPRVVVLLQARLDGEIVTTLAAGDGGAAGQAAVRVLEEQRFEVITRLRGGLAADEDPGEPSNQAKNLLLADEVAADLARSSGAGAAVIIGVLATSEDRVRATRLFGAAGQASVRVLEVAGDGSRRVARGKARGAGFADSSAHALDAAASDAAIRALGEIADALADIWPAPAGPGAGTGTGTGTSTAIEIRGYRGWQAVDALIRHLAKTRGITRVWPVKLGSRGVTLAVDTDLDDSRLLAAIRRAELPSGQRFTGRKRGTHSLEARLDAGSGGSP